MTSFPSERSRRYGNRWTTDRIEAAVRELAANQTHWPTRQHR